MVDKDSTILVKEKLKDNSDEVINDEKVSVDGEGQTNSQTEDIKDPGSERVLSDEDEPVGVVAESETINASKSVEKSLDEETGLESNTISESEKE